MEIDLLTLFPKMVEGFFNESIIGRAQKSGIVTIKVHNLRDWSLVKNKVVDDRPFGGGAGMVLKPEPIFLAWNELKRKTSQFIYLCPDGETLNSNISKELSRESHLVFLSGHYEGIDERVRQELVSREISIGDYVLTNGTIAAAVVIDSLLRQIKGVLGDEKCLTHDSFEGNYLSFPQYTRPSIYKDLKVPSVLLSGNHGEIKDWRRKQQFLRTKERRPDLQRKLRDTDI